MDLMIMQIKFDIINERSISKVYWNNMFGVDENRRDQELQNILNDNSIDYETFDDQVVYSPELSQQWRISFTQFSSI